MKTRSIILALGAVFALLPSAKAFAQQDTLVEITDVTIEEMANCQNHYYSNWRNNWFIQLGAGTSVPLVENYLSNGDAKRQFTLAMNVGVGHWFSPYVGIRFSALGGALHWENGDFSKAKYANLNFDLMWDMFNSLGNVNTQRVFSIIPFVGMGGTLTWDINSQGSNIYGKHGLKTRSWTLPVSAGIQMRFRLCSYANFFIEGRAQFYGDNFNGAAYGRPIDVNTALLGGFQINLSKPNFKSFSPCAYLNYINQLNNQVNDLRAQLANCNSNLAAAEAQLPCPQVQQPAAAPAPAALLATVRFTINSAKISKEEMVNVYNVAQWMKANEDAHISINGYADKDTGTAQYNQGLSQRRAQAVCDALVNQYGIDPSRLTVDAFGSETQPFGTNNWNRIVIFKDK